jgi:hypothetical protein
MRNTPTMRFMCDEDGGPLVEAAVMIPILLTFFLGSVDFMNAFMQWNQATKAVEVGARIAAVSDPVASGLNTIPTSALSSSRILGDTMPDFQVTCDGGTRACSCTRGTCTGMGAYSATAMGLIVFTSLSRTGATRMIPFPVDAEIVKSSGAGLMPMRRASSVVSDTVVAPVSTIILRRLPLTVGSTKKWPLAPATSVTEFGSAAGRGVA